MVENLMEENQSDNMMKAFLGKIENVFSGSRFEERAKETPEESKKFTFMDYSV